MIMRILLRLSISFSQHTYYTSFSEPLDFDENDLFLNS